jgi:hypothetical protein
VFGRLGELRFSLLNPPFVKRCCLLGRLGPTSHCSAHTKNGREPCPRAKLKSSFATRPGRGHPAKHCSLVPRDPQTPTRRLISPNPPPHVWRLLVSRISSSTRLSHLLVDASHSITRGRRRAQSGASSAAPRTSQSRGEFCHASNDGKLRQGPPASPARGELRCATDEPSQGRAPPRLERWQASPGAAGSSTPGASSAARTRANSVRDAPPETRRNGRILHATASRSRRHGRISPRCGGWMNQGPDCFLFFSLGTYL